MPTFFPSRFLFGIVTMCLVYVTSTVDNVIAAGSANTYHSLTFEKLVFTPQKGQFFQNDPRTHLFILSFLKKKGFNVLGGENVVFNVDRSHQARMQLGGIVERAVCGASNFSGYEICDAAVLWQIFDSAAGEVIYQALTRGHRILKTGEEIDLELMRRILEVSLEKLVSKPKFIDVLRIKNLPSTNTELMNVSTFRECGASLKLPKQLGQTMQATITINNGASHGSGVVISKDGYVLSAAHVVAGLSETTIRSSNGDVLPATVIRRDSIQDVALLKIDSGKLPCLDVNLTLPATGAQTFAVGTPLEVDFSSTVTKGIISGVRRIKGGQFIQTDTPVNPGNSGGPLLDEQGKIVGLIASKVVMPEAEGIAFAASMPMTLASLAIAPGSKTTIVPTPIKGGRTVSKIVEPPEKKPIQYCFKQEFGGKLCIIHKNNRLR